MYFLKYIFIYYKNLIIPIGELMNKNNRKGQIFNKNKEERLKIPLNVLSKPYFQLEFMEFCIGRERDMDDQV